MPTLKLTFTPSELTDDARAYLEQRFMQEDYESMWLSIDSLLEELADDWMEGLTIDASTINWEKTSLKDIPKAWWKRMAFSPKMERAIKAFWKKHPTGEIEWSW
jgi:hypothetical protein